MTDSEDFEFAIKREKLSDFYEMILRCNKAGFCRNVQPIAMVDERFGDQCPPGRNHQYETYYAGGLLEMGRALLEGSLEPTAKYLDIINRCTTCGFCDYVCNLGVRITPLKIINKIKSHCVEHGFTLESHRTMWERLERSFNFYGEPHESRMKWLETMNVDKVKSAPAYFVGCTTCYRRSEIASSTVKLLQHFHVDFDINDDEQCCGAPAFQTGNEKLGQKMIGRAIETIEKSGSKEIIFSDPQCMFAFQCHLRNSKFKLLHVSELFARLIKERSPKIQEINRKVAYHDPCYLGRHLGIYESPRQLLNFIPGIQLVDLPRNRFNSFCCGAAGGVLDAFPDECAKTAEHRLEELDYVGAEALVSADPLCKEAFLKVAEKNPEIHVYDIVELISQAVIRC
jgi:heterodisulfide reductase subunit D